MKNKTEIWEAIKHELINDTSAARVWLDGTELVFLGTASAIIFVESDFARTVVKERFGERIASLLKHRCERDINVRFVGRDEFFSLREEQDDPVKVELKSIICAMEDIGTRLDQLIAQLDCIIEDIENM